MLSISNGCAGAAVGRPAQPVGEGKRRGTRNRTPPAPLAVETAPRGVPLPSPPARTPLPRGRGGCCGRARFALARRWPPGRRRYESSLSFWAMALDRSSERWYALFVGLLFLFVRCCSHKR